VFVSSLILLVDIMAVVEAVTAAAPFLLESMSPSMAGGNLPSGNAPVLGDASLEFVMGSLGPSFMSALVASLCIIIVSELGDKTFFIAALMSMKHSHVVVFTGAFAALTVMTTLSTVVGYALPNLLSPIYTHYASVVLFLFFGSRMIFDGIRMVPHEGSDELAEVEAELSKKDHEVSSIPSSSCSADPEHIGGVSPMSTMTECPDSQPAAPPNRKTTKVAVVKSGGGAGGVVTATAAKATSFTQEIMFLAQRSINVVLLQAFTLTFLAEWGDRSQIATIALAASKDPYGVTFGALIGHFVCTGLAVIGGKMLASSISEKAVTLAGGALFLLFGFTGLFTGV